VNFNTDSGHKIVIDAQPGYYNKGKWENSGLFYRFSPTTGPAFSVSNDYVEVKNIMFGLTAAANAHWSVYSYGENNLFDRCVFKALSLGSYESCKGIILANKTTELRFCIATDFINGGNGFHKHTAGGGLVTLLNCGSYNNGVGYRCNEGDLAAINCISVGDAQGFSGNFHVSSTTNASGDGTARGAGAISYISTNVWKNAVGYDFRLESGSTAISKRGLNRTAVVAGVYHDLDQNRLPGDNLPWDIGPYYGPSNLWVPVYVMPRKGHRQQLESQQLRRLRAVWAIAKRKVSK
jgi:hypothetical protein